MCGRGRGCVCVLLCVAEIEKRREEGEEIKRKKMERIEGEGRRTQDQTDFRETVKSPVTPRPTSRQGSVCRV